MKKGSKWKVQFLVMAFCVLGLVAVLVGSSYAIFSDVSDQGDYNTVTAGTLQLSYEDTQSLSLSNLYPVSDVEGMTGEGYTFTVRNIGTLPSDYKVMIQDDEAMIQADGCSDHLMPKANIKISVDGGTPFLLSSIEESNYMITTGNLQPGDSVTHVVKVWIDEASGNEILGTHFHGKVVVEGIQGEFVYRDESGANPPELVDGMIPVTYNGTNWVKADTSSKWYDYNNQEWANAVTVTEMNRATYMSAEAGTVIPMEDINTMWVWIPRYSYTIGNSNGVQGYGGRTPSRRWPGAIDIKFVDVNTKETGTAQYTGSEPSNWRTSPGFTFGEEELSGFWYGKFELVGEETNGECGDDTCSTDDIGIVPNGPPLTLQSLLSLFHITRSMQMNSSNPYGFSSEAGDLHMSKSSEWAAVAYLSQSKYGKYGNLDYKEEYKEIFKNGYFFTGKSSGFPEGSEFDATYDVPYEGTGASTTGTIYGVYDMCGGVHEYVMSLYDGPIDLRGIQTKYYESLGTLTDDTGYALNESVFWYYDEQEQEFFGSAVFLRGGSYMHTIGAGIFHIAVSDGEPREDSGTRAVYVP